MNYFIFTAIIALAASKSKNQVRDNNPNKEGKDNSDVE